MIRLLQSVVWLFLLAGSSLGADTISPAPLPWSGNGGQPSAAVPGYGNVVLTAAALVILVGLGLYFIKNGSLPFRASGGVERKLHVRETRMLGSRQFLVVVEYEDSKLLLGVTPGKIDYLCALDSRPASATNFGEMMVNTAPPQTPGEKV